MGLVHVLVSKRGKSWARRERDSREGVYRRARSRVAAGLPSRASICDRWVGVVAWSAAVFVPANKCQGLLQAGRNLI